MSDAYQAPRVTQQVVTSQIGTYQVGFEVLLLDSDASRRPVATIGKELVQVLEELSQADRLQLTRVGNRAGQIENLTHDAVLEQRAHEQLPEACHSFANGKNEYDFKLILESSL